MQKLTEPEPTSVECYSGGRFAERPVAFTWRGEKMRVASVERAWHTSQGLAFLVRLADSRYFELTYTVSRDEWTACEMGLGPVE